MAVGNYRIGGELIFRVLREAEKLPVNEVARKYGLSDAAIYTWRKKFGTCDLQEVIRLRQLDLKGGRRKKSAVKTLAS
ncbi:MAG TPA: transposase [Steroidobacteraceae bacterium]|jgi:putative transposase|nr:transposase [Steroidobacteraceae bacterium]